MSAVICDFDLTRSAQKREYDAAAAWVSRNVGLGHRHQVVVGSVDSRVIETSASAENRSKGRFE